jgi:hypothetical protein
VTSSTATPSSAASTPRTRDLRPSPGHDHHLLPSARRARRARRFRRLSGLPIPPYYDSLIGKLIVHGRNPQRMPDAAAPRARRVRRRRHQDHAAAVRESMFHRQDRCQQDRARPPRRAVARWRLPAARYAIHDRAPARPSAASRSRARTTSCARGSPDARVRLQPAVARSTCAPPVALSTVASSRGPRRRGRPRRRSGPAGLAASAACSPLPVSAPAPA